MFQHTAARRRLGRDMAKQRLFVASFNTQPPEGGWPRHQRQNAYVACFNTQPPEGGWIVQYNAIRILPRFNTQPPEGGWIKSAITLVFMGGFNTQPPEGGWFCYFQDIGYTTRVSTHSRPKAAGKYACPVLRPCSRFNTQPPEGGWAATVDADAA